MIETGIKHRNIIENDDESLGSLPPRIPEGFHRK